MSQVYCCRNERCVIFAALRKSMINHVVLSPETVEEVKRHSSPVHNLTNVPCRLNVESTLPSEWSDGMEHNCRNIKEYVGGFHKYFNPLTGRSSG